MYGPCLPIYGFGAIVMLFVTLPVRDNYLLTYILSLAGATLLEYVTGVIMEMIFKVRYWDYSYQHFNYKGYICLSSSIAWGFFGILLVNVIHKPIEKFVLGFSTMTTETLALLFVAIFSADFSLSVRHALDIKATIKRIITENDELTKLKEKLEKAVTLVNEERKEFVDNFDEMKLSYQLKKEQFTIRLEAVNSQLRSLVKRNPSLRFKKISLHDLFKFKD